MTPVITQYSCQTMQLNIITIDIFDYLCYNEVISLRKHNSNQKLKYVNPI